MRIIRCYSLVRECQCYSIQPASSFPHRHFCLCFSVRTHTWSKFTCWYEGQGVKVLIVVQRVRQVHCSSPSSKHLTDNSAAIHGLPKNLHCTINFFHAGTMFKKTVLNFFLVMLFPTVRSRKKCIESVYLHVFQMQLYWIYKEVIQDICNY